MVPEKKVLNFGVHLLLVSYYKNNMMGNAQSNINKMGQLKTQYYVAKQIN